MQKKSATLCVFLLTNARRQCYFVQIVKLYKIHHVQIASSDKLKYDYPKKTQVRFCWINEQESPEQKKQGVAN
jgi:hypothetical protein